MLLSDIDDLINIEKNVRRIGNINGLICLEFDIALASKPP